VKHYVHIREFSIQAASTTQKGLRQLYEVKGSVQSRKARLFTVQFDRPNLRISSFGVGTRLSTRRELCGRPRCATAKHINIRIASSGLYANSITIRYYSYKHRLEPIESVTKICRKWLAG
jgi:hypothetical protein